MVKEAIEYVEPTPQGGWRIASSRVSLDSIIHGYLDGQSPEQIADSFPTLSLEQIHGTIAFYLRKREGIDGYLQAQDADWEQLRQCSEAQHGTLLARLRERREAEAA